MSVKYELFGTTPEGEKVGKFILNNCKGITATIMSLGGTLISLKMPDREGEIKEVTLGFDNLQQYLSGHSYFGAAIGRFANRIANGVFQLDGVKYSLARNEKGLNHLHGGNKGFDKVVWQANPPGEIKTVYATPMDFTKPKLIGKDINDTAVGYDHCFVIESSN
jgi:aldose 1-epimerase